MENLEEVSADDFIISKANDFISDVMRKINNNQLKCVIVLDENSRLLGTISDGDIRRGLLQGKKIDDHAENFMNLDPVRVSEKISKNEVYSLFEKFALSILPIVDFEDRVRSCYIKRYGAKNTTPNCSVLIMAGGKGKRLASIISDSPKPLIDFGTGQTLLEILINKLTFCGFNNIYISVNHLAHKIIELIGDGDRWNCNINYIIEDIPLGTAGSIFLLPNSCQEYPVLVVNADLVITDNFGDLLNLHLNSKKDISVVTKKFELELQYGVIDENFKITEKPILKFDILSGIYFFSKLPDCSDIKRELQMNELLQLCKAHGASFNEIKLRGDWIDIGTVESYSNLRKELKDL